mgnify:FL=1
MSKYTLSKIFFISLFLCFVFYSVNVLSQEALILTKSGEKINCIIQDVEITIKTEAGVKKLAISDIALIDFVSNAKQVSAKAYLHLLRGKQLIKDGFDDMALAEFKIAVDTSPDYVDANFEMGKLLGKMGRKNEAMGYLGRVLTLEPDRLGIDVELKDIGDWYLNKKDFKSAADIYYSLFQKYPQNKNAEFAVYKAGFLYAWELNDSKKAIPALEGAVAKFPDNENVEKALYEIGRLYSDESNLESAEKYFTQLITKFPSGERTDNAHFSLAKVYQQKREYLKAIDEIHKVIDESSDQALIISAQKLIDEFMWDIYSVSDGLPSDNIKALALDKNRVWIGTASGVAQFDIKSSSFIGSIILPNTDITALAVDETYLWIGTADSLVKQYDKVKGDMVQNPLIKSQGSINKILSLSVDKDSVWVGTDFGIYQYMKNKLDWKHYTTLDGLPDDKIVSLASTPKGVWCGTLKNGVSIFDYSTLKWRKPNVQASLSGRSVPMIAFSNNNIWFAWYEDFMNGVSSYDQNTGTWEELPITEWESDTQSQTPDVRHVNTSLICLGANESEVWVGTDSVAVFYNYMSSQWSPPINYPSKFAGIAPSCIAVDNESVWFATVKGVAKLKKGMIKTN